MLIIALYSATGVLRQTIFWPMYLFSRYMRGGTAVQVSLSSGAYSGETLPQWLGVVAGPRRELDASASLVTLDGGRRSLRLAVVNRGETTDYANVPIRVLGVDGAEVEEVEVHELWHQDVKVRNTWEQPEVVTVQTRREKWTGHWTFRAHSFTLLVIDH
jgi:alpha-L-arabinofuranosidase